jgi:hypothetical protein
MPMRASLIVMQNEASRILIGESFIGEGDEAAHINTVLGDRAGPGGVVWATALASPRPGQCRSSRCFARAFRSSR